MRADFGGGGSTSDPSHALCMCRSSPSSPCRMRRRRSSDAASASGGALLVNFAATSQSGTGFELDFAADVMPECQPREELRALRGVLSSGAIAAPELAHGAHACRWVIAGSATLQASAEGPPEAVRGGHFPSLFRRAPAAPWLLAVSPSGFARPQRAVEAGKGEDARSAAQALRRSAPGRSAQRKAGRRPTETP